MRTTHTIRTMNKTKKLGNITYLSVYKLSVC